MYDTLVNEIDSWPYAARKGLNYIGTLPVAICAVFMLTFVVWTVIYILLTFSSLQHVPGRGALAQLSPRRAHPETQG